MKKILLLIAIISCFAFHKALQRKIVRQNNTTTECYVSLKKLKDFDIKKHYYWYKAGEIHVSQANAGGFVLHDEYVKYAQKNHLLEKGQFKYGLKDGIWKSWHNCGTLKSYERWSKGVKNGIAMNYDQEGNLLEVGEYKENKKVGKWVNHKTKDTLKYKLDKIIVTDSVKNKKQFFKKIFKKKDSVKETKYTGYKGVVNYKKGEKRKAHRDSNTSSKLPSSRTKMKIEGENFFKRWFKKWNKKKEEQ